MNDSNKGYYNKYNVRKRYDPEYKHENCTFFVLDLNHDPYAIYALKAYVASCKSKYPKLAWDLEVLIDKFKVKNGKESSIE